jgi:hypothetical protein
MIERLFVIPNWMETVEGRERLKLRGLDESEALHHAIGKRETLQR